MHLTNDFRFAARALLKRPALTGLAVLMLVVGMAASASVFTLVNGILLRPLPYRDPDRLVLLDETAHKRGRASMAVSFPNFLDWKEQNSVFEGIAAHQSGSFTLTGTGSPERLQGAAVSHGLFEILGIAPIHGRTFLPEEDRPNADGVVMLSEGLWRSRFGADPGIVGQELRLNSSPRLVVGIMPAGFRYPSVARLWVPLALDTRRWTRTDHGLTAIARLRGGVGLPTARAEMDTIARRIEAAHPVTNDGLGVAVLPLRDQLAGGYRQALALLLAAVGFVLLISCANIISVLLVRASGRQKEMAVRTAMGARRADIFRLLFVESLMLSALGGAVGLLLSRGLLRIVLGTVPVELPFWMNFDPDIRVWAFAGLIILLTGTVFGLAPAVQAFRSDLNSSLKEGGRSLVANPGRQRLQKMLVMGEVALTTVLLVGAGLMIKSFLQLQGVEPGFRAENLLTMQVSLPSSKYSRQERTPFFEQIRERIEGLPGIQAAGFVSNLPLTGSAWGRSLTVEGLPVLGVGEEPMINHRVILPGYFRAMGIALLQGRDFMPSDNRGSTPVVIINQSLAREFFSEVDPLGKRIRLGPPEDQEPWHQIVGVVGDVRHDALNSASRRGVYIPHSQLPVGGLTVIVRASTGWEQALAAVRSSVRELDPDLPLTNVSSMEQIRSRSIWQPQLYTHLFHAFAILAVALAAIGVYGVTAYWVSMRTHELGIRRALGAVSGDVLRLVLGQSMRIIAAGLGLGLLGSLLLAKSLSSLLFQVSTTDPWVFAAASLLLTLVALIAGTMPARKASRVDPMIALRSE